MGDVLFVNGETPTVPQMLFTLSGMLSYSRQGGLDVNCVGIQEKQSRRGRARSSSIMHRVANMDPISTWVSEAALWCTWTHCGCLRAESDCRLLALDAGSFQVIAPQFHCGAEFHLGTYAQEYVSRLNSHCAVGILSDVDEENLSAASVSFVLSKMNITQVNSSQKGVARGSEVSIVSNMFKGLHRQASKVFGGMADNHSIAESSGTSCPNSRRSSTNSDFSNDNR